MSGSSLVEILDLDFFTTTPGKRVHAVYTLSRHHRVGEPERLDGQFVPLVREHPDTFDQPHVDFSAVIKRRVCVFVEADDVGADASTTHML